MVHASKGEDRLPLRMNWVLVPISLWTVIRGQRETSWFQWRIECQRRSVEGVTEHNPRKHPKPAHPSVIHCCCTSNLVIIYVEKLLHEIEKQLPSDSLHLPYSFHTDRWRARVHIQKHLEKAGNSSDTSSARQPAPCTLIMHLLATLLW